VPGPFRLSVAIGPLAAPPPAPPAIVAAATAVTAAGVFLLFFLDGIAGLLAFASARLRKAEAVDILAHDVHRALLEGHRRIEDGAEHGLVGVAGAHRDDIASVRKIDHLLGQRI